ncbi:hypothetical protein ACEWY4_010656 [Coilia grayii]|uniref:Homeobox domain-containing protein n=1 Tax=Coilia grayii TaxID=363190 RepID=A0ABD1K2I0_9TELE
MAHSQSYLYQPSATAYPCAANCSSGVIGGPRPEEIGRSSGSAFAPYVGSAAQTRPVSLNSVQIRTESGPALFSSFMGAPLDHTSSMTGSLGYHPYVAYPFGDPSYRKNATRDATATLKTWLNEHRKNPYPTKGEKIMLAIITKMTLTQVSTWFANARRRLKKENKVTWTHRSSRSEDEDEDDHIDLEKHEDATYGSAFNSDDKQRKICNIYNEERSTVDPLSCYSEPKEKEHGLQEDISTSLALNAFTQDKSLGTGGPSCAQTPCNGRGTPTIPVPRSPTPNPKPKLWSLAEIATSPGVRSSAHPVCTSGEEGDCAVISTSVRSPCNSSLRCHLLNNVMFPRHLYYASSVYTRFTNSDSQLDGGPGSSPAAAPHVNGFNQFVTQRGTEPCAVTKVLHAKSKTCI